MSAAQRRIWHTYRAANIVLSVVNGIYGAYAFIYLKHRLQSAGGVSEGVLDNLLVVIVGSMFFEFFAEPITGDWADTFGRKRMVIGTYWGLCLAFLAYWMISSEVVSQLPAASEVRVIIALSLLAEVFYAVASALFNGALDAWFVDELRLVQGPQGAELLRFFTAQRRWSGIVMVSAGAASLWIASAAFDRPPGAATNDGLTSVAALPWLAAALITAGAALWALLRLTEHRVVTKTHEPSHRRILQRLKRTLAQRELRNALLVSSVLYTCWICFMYLLPVLLTEPGLVREAGFLQAILKNYYWYYLAMGTSRFLGPYLSGRLAAGVQPIVQFRWWGVLNCGALALAGAALLLRGGDGARLNVVLVPSALVLFWVSKVAEEAFKPVRSMYLNYLIKDGGDRAFVLSMATPFGAILILFGVGGLAVAQHFVSSLDEVAMSVPLLFGILGALGSVMAVKLSWSKRPSS
jgi:MFS family permease